MRSEENLKRWADKWDSNFIPCQWHPGRRCSRYFYIHSRAKRCASCIHRNAQGVRHPWKVFRESTATNEQRLWKQRSRRRNQRIVENKI